MDLRLSNMHNGEIHCPYTQHIHTLAKSLMNSIHRPDVGTYIVIPHGLLSGLRHAHVLERIKLFSRCSGYITAKWGSRHLCNITTSDLADESPLYHWRKSSGCPVEVCYSEWMLACRPFTHSPTCARLASWFCCIGECYPTTHIDLCLAECSSAKYISAYWYFFSFNPV